MSKELILIVNSVANEKNIPKGIVLASLEKALANLCRKESGEDALVEVALDDSGNMTAERLWDVVADDVRLENLDRQIRLMDALEMNPEATVGIVLREKINTPQLTRVAARSLYQNLVQNLREAERKLVADEWLGRRNELCYATVKRLQKGNAYLDIEGDEAILPRNEQIGDRLVIGQRLAVVVTELNTQSSGPVLIASRSSTALLTQLLEREIPEISEGKISIIKCVRSRNYRTKILVESQQENMSAVPVCIGYRGNRIQAISDAINQERLELIEWQGSMLEQLEHMLKGTAHESFTIEEDARRILIETESKETIKHFKMSHGPNYHMLSQLYDYTFIIDTPSVIEEMLIVERNTSIEKMAEGLNAEEEVAELLYDFNFKSIEQIAESELHDLMGVDGFDEELALEVQKAALAYLQVHDLNYLMNLHEELAKQEWGGLNDMPSNIWEELKKKGILTHQDVADCALFELEDVPGLTSEKAAQIIMEARNETLFLV